jgi:hypothetical protein
MIARHDKFIDREHRGQLQPHDLRSDHRMPERVPIAQAHEPVADDVAAAGHGHPLLDCNVEAGALLQAPR